MIPSAVTAGNSSPVLRDIFVLKLLRVRLLWNWMRWPGVKNYPAIVFTACCTIDNKQELTKANAKSVAQTSPAHVLQVTHSMQLANR